MSQRSGFDDINNAPPAKFKIMSPPSHYNTDAAEDIIVKMLFLQAGRQYHANIVGL